MKRKCDYGVVCIIAVVILTSFMLISCSKEKPPIEESYKVKVLKGTWEWDIDLDADEPKESVDIWWEHVNERERYLVPMNGSGLAVVSDKTFENLNLSDLKKMELAGSRISASDEKPDIDVGTVLAVRTTEGNLVKVEVTGFDPLNNRHSKYNMRMRYVLYKVQEADDAPAEP